jgi:hypothetical protein
MYIINGISNLDVQREVLKKSGIYRIQERYTWERIAGMYSNLFQADK